MSRSTRLKDATLKQLGAVLALSPAFPTDSRALLLDAGIWVSFVRADGQPERWDTGVIYHEISVDLSDGRSLEEHLEHFVRDTAKDDIVADMQVDGYAMSDTALDDFEVTWEIAADLSNHARTARDDHG